MLLHANIQSLLKSWWRAAFRRDCFLMVQEIFQLKQRFCSWKEFHLLDFERIKRYLGAITAYKYLFIVYHELHKGKWFYESMKRAKNQFLQDLTRFNDSSHSCHWITSRSWCHILHHTLRKPWTTRNQGWCPPTAWNIQVFDWKKQV